MAQSPSDTRRDAGTFLGVVWLSFMGLGFLVLIAMVLPQALRVLWVLAAFALAVVVQYLVWGRWLMSRRPADFDDSPDHARKRGGIDRSEDAVGDDP